MRYDKYLKKILAFARILKTIRRYRLLISIVASIAIVSIATFMGVQGMVYDSVACPTEIEYGDTLPFEANAVFRSVRYEYASQSSPDNWTEIAPTLPGTYHVRATSTSTFGTPRYGDVYTYTIIPRKINVGVEQSQIIYGDEPSVIAPLVYGDTISGDSLLKFLKSHISIYSATVKNKKLKEIYPEILAKNSTDPSDFTMEFVRLLKGWLAE